MSDVKAMTDDWTLKMAARNQRGQRLFEVDAKYRNEVTALGVRIAELKKAEAVQPQINQEHLAWIARAQGAVDKDGKRLYQYDSIYAKNVEAARAKVCSGGDISVNITATEQVLTQQQAKMGPEFTQPTSRQHALAHEAGLTLGVHHSVGGGAGTIVTNITPGTA